MALSDTDLLRLFDVPADPSLAELMPALRAVERAVREDVLRELGGGVDVEKIAREAYPEHNIECDEYVSFREGPAPDLDGGCDCELTNARRLLAAAIRTAVAQARVEWERERESSDVCHCCGMELALPALPPLCTGCEPSWDRYEDGREGCDAHMTLPEEPKP